MPSASKKQHNLMAAVANNPKFAKQVGIKQSVGEDFMKADKGRKFAKGGTMRHDDVAEDKKMIKKAVKMHDDQLHGGKKTNLTKLKTGGIAKTVTKEMEYDYKTGKKLFDGSTAKRDAHAEKEGKIVAKHAAYDKEKGRAFKKGGAVIDGIAKRGKTKGTMVKMCGGGMAKKGK